MTLTPGQQVACPEMAWVPTDVSFFNSHGMDGWFEQTYKLVGTLTLDGHPIALRANARQCAQQTSQPTSKNDASSSSESNYHSSPGSPDGSPANTSTSPKNTPVARATKPPQRTGNTSRNAPSIQAGAC